MGIFDFLGKKNKSKSISEKANILKDRKIESPAKKVSPNILAEDIKEVIKSIGSKIKQYNDVKKNLPEVNQNATSTFSPSIGTTISLADYWSKNPTNTFSYYIGNPTSSTSL